MACKHITVLGKKTFCCINQGPHVTQHVMVAEDRISR